MISKSTVQRAPATEHACALQELLATTAAGRLVLDLKDIITLVDRAAVRFLARVEMAGTGIVNCPEDVRRLIAAEEEKRWFVNQWPGGERPRIYIAGTSWDTSCWGGRKRGT